MNTIQMNSSKGWWWR